MAKRPTEIERKWLIDNPPDLSKRKGTKIIQGYIAVSRAGVEIRVRALGARFFETIKNGKGLQRDEIEIELSRKQFKSLWRATRGKRVEKIRYSMKWQGRKIELDVYKKQCAGLVLAEVEFKSRKQASNFSPPAWFGPEVTDDEEYRNAKLANRRQKKRTPRKPGVRQ